MPTATVNATIARVTTLLQDPKHVRWKEAELLEWLNEGQRAIVVRMPSAYTRTADVNLVAGTKQTIPAGGIKLLEVVRNVDGDAVLPIERSTLDNQVPGWHTMSKAKGVQHVCYKGDTDPKTFYVYPPNTGAGQVEMVYSVTPPDAALGGVISLDDVYQAALVDYMLYRAFSKDSEYAADPGRVSAHFTSFINSLGGKQQPLPGNVQG